MHDSELNTIGFEEALNGLSSNDDPSIVLPSIFFGTFQTHCFKDMHAVIAAVVGSGIKAFNTAPTHINERFVGGICNLMIDGGRVKRRELFISTKIDGWQLAEKTGNVLVHGRHASEKLQMNYLDDFLVHWSFGRYLERIWLCLNEAKNLGLAGRLFRHWA